MGMATPIIMGMAFIPECPSRSDTAEVGTAAVTIIMAAADGMAEVVVAGTEAGAGAGITNTAESSLI
jgi:hypothetical protein